jgi:ABC-2 type transport system ATP-binding protein
MAIDRTTAILRTEGLTKRYGNTVGLDDLTITVHRGEVFGYIGPNGAGKTTTFRILCGLMDPSAGEAFVADQNVTGNKDLIKRLVGFLPDNFGVYPTLQVWEYMDFFAAAYKVPKKQRAERIDFCLRIANAAEFRDKLMGTLSRGMKQRVGIAKTLLHDPQVLILDEPAATIDPRARVQMRELLRDLANLGKAVLVSSHILPELSDVCDTVGILSSGKLICCGPVEDILRRVRGERRLVEISVLRDAAVAQRILRDEAPGGWVQVQGRAPTNGTLHYECRCSDQELSQSLLLLFRGNVPVVNFSEVPPDLEEAFMTLTN